MGVEFISCKRVFPFYEQCTLFQVTLEILAHLEHLDHPEFPENLERTLSKAELAQQDHLVSLANLEVLDALVKQVVRASLASLECPAKMVFLAKTVPLDLPEVLVALDSLDLQDLIRCIVRVQDEDARRQSRRRRYKEIAAHWHAIKPCLLEMVFC